jgi:type I restriction enzyme S subunit
MNRYQSYKQSGVEWIGEIPERWNSEPLKYYFDYTKGSNGQKLTKTYIDENPGIYPVYSGMTENDGVLGFVNEFEFDYSFPLIFTTTVGSRSMTTKILNGKFSLSQNCLVMIRKKECNTSFIQYFLSFDFPFRKSLLPTIFQPSLRMEDLDQYKIIIPPLQEQLQIVEFLDEKTELIDKLISTKERKTTLLKEQRISLINEVVTKGLNPNVKMKFSDFDWIGKIPEHWGLKRICYVFRPISIKNNFNEINLSVYRDYGVILTDSRDDNHNVISEDTSNYKLVQIGDFVMNKMKCWMGSLGLSDYRGIVSPSYTVMRPITNENRKYLHYLLRSQLYIPQYRRLSYGVRVGQWDMRFEDFRELPCILPPIEEQNKIVEFLDIKTKEINDLVSLEQRKIDLLKEYRQSLISEVVTGKVKVTN